MLRCPSCQSPYSEGDVFCGNCGYNLAENKPNLDDVPTRHPAPENKVNTSDDPASEDTAAALPKELTALNFGDFEPPAKPSPKSEKAEQTEPIGKWQCLSCGSENVDSDDYCETCGAPSPRLIEENSASTQPTQPALELPVPTPRGNGSKPGWTFNSASLTNEGIERRGTTNEDSVFTLELRRFFGAKPESFGLYIVSDGMGGMAAGEVASKITIETVSNMLMEKLGMKWLSGHDVKPEQIGPLLKDAVQAAHEKVSEYNREKEVESGATITMACLVDGKAYFANVGDSRTYLYRANPQPEALEHPENNNLRSAKTKKINRTGDTTDPAIKIPPKLQRVTRDQSYVQELVEKGEITLDDVYTHPRRNVVLAGLGQSEATVPVDTYERDLADGDIVVVSSDGLWEMIRDNIISQHIESTPDLNQLAADLVQLACDNGGADNVSVVLAKAEYK